MDLKLKLSFITTNLFHNTLPVISLNSKTNSPIDLRIRERRLDFFIKLQ